jgi:hypothetical protein
MNADCASGLGCALATHVCAPITLASAGQPCDGATTRCWVGSCLASAADAGVSVCPDVIPDGQSCAAQGDQCDDFADCIGGVCTIQNTQRCM